MAVQMDRKKLLEKYSDFYIPPLKSNSQIMKYVDLYFELQPIPLFTKDIEFLLRNFKKNLLIFIHQEDFSKCGTIKEIINLEEQLDTREMIDVDIHCFRLLPNQRNRLFFGDLYEDSSKKVYLFNAAQYNYLESNDSLLNTILVQQKGLNPEEAILKSDLYFAYLDILKRLDELGFILSSMY